MVVGLLLVASIFMWFRKRIFRFRRKHSSRWRDVLRIVSITLSFAQINTSFPVLMINFPWPTAYLEFLKQWVFVELDLMELLGAKCIGGDLWDYRARIVAMTALPVLLLICGRLGFCYSNRVKSAKMARVIEQKTSMSVAAHASNVSSGTRRTRHNSLATGLMQLQVYDRERLDRAFARLFDLADSDCSGFIEPPEFKMLMHINLAGLEDPKEYHWKDPQILELMRQVGTARYRRLSKSRRTAPSKPAISWSRCPYDQVSVRVHGQREATEQRKRESYIPQDVLANWVAYSENVGARNLYMSMLLVCLFFCMRP